MTDQTTTTERDLFEVFKRTRRLTDRATVAFSTGKDALVVLDVASCMGFKLAGYFMYLVPGLRCQESYLKLIEARYRIEILRVPHLALSELIKSNTYRFDSAPGEKVQYTEFRDLRAYVRKQTGNDWIISGEKKTDSLQRRGMLSDFNCIDEKNQNAFPLADWSDKRVWTYINLHRLPICPTYGAHAIHSYEPHDPKAILAMQAHYPDDVERVLEYFPLLRAEIVKQQIRKRA